MSTVGVWPDVRLRHLLVPASAGPAAPPYPLRETHTRIYGRARQAIRAGVLALGLERGDEVLVPAYHHGSEVQALLAAGLRCTFFDPDVDLQPPSDVLEARAPTARALHLIHYLGFPQPGARWRCWCDAHGLRLVEDAAQAWLASDSDGPVGSHGDLAVFCLYKSCGLPDGAAVVGRVPLPAPAGGGPTGLRAVLAPWARRVLRPAGSAAAPAYDHAADIAVAHDDAPPSRVTQRLLPRLRAEGVAAQRRRNFRELQTGLLDLVAEPFRDLPPGASPFAFPVVVEDKHVALAHLRRHGVEGLDLWSRPHPSLPGGDWPVSDYLRRHVVGLPVHQQLRPRDLDAIRSAARHLVPPRRRLEDVCRSRC